MGGKSELTNDWEGAISLYQLATLRWPIAEESCAETISVDRGKVQVEIS